MGGELRFFSRTSLPIGYPLWPTATLPHPPVSYDPHPIRWIDIVLPHPEDPDRWLTLKADGPFALRPWYFAPGTRTEIKLHLDVRTPEGGLKGCLHCGSSELYTKTITRWGLVALMALPGAVLTFWFAALGVFLMVVAGVIGGVLSRRELVCYACGTQHRGFRMHPVHPPFDPSLARAK